MFGEKIQWQLLDYNLGWNYHMHGLCYRHDIHISRNSSLFMRISKIFLLFFNVFSYNVLC
jgi:hypothetical protein